MLSPLSTYSAIWCPPPRSWTFPARNGSPSDTRSLGEERCRRWTPTACSTSRIERDSGMLLICICKVYICCIVYLSNIIICNIDIKYVFCKNNKPAIYIYYFENPGSLCEISFSVNSFVWGVSESRSLRLKLIQAQSLPRNKAALMKVHLLTWHRRISANNAIISHCIV